MNEQAKRILKLAKTYNSYDQENKQVFELIQWLDLSLSWQDEQFIHRLVEDDEDLETLINILEKM